MLLLGMHNVQARDACLSVVTVFNDVATQSALIFHYSAFSEHEESLQIPYISQNTLVPQPIFHLKCSLAIVVQQLETWDKLLGLKTAAQREHSNKNIRTITIFCTNGRP